MARGQSGGTVPHSEKDPESIQVQRHSNRVCARVIKYVPTESIKVARQPDLPRRAQKTVLRISSFSTLSTDQYRPLTTRTTVAPVPLTSSPMILYPHRS